GRDSDEFLAIEENLVDTLRAFVNPYDREDDEHVTFRYEIQQFDKAFWETGNYNTILDYREVFDYSNFSALEHKIEG
ncbi:hypothetical protein, partial [Streptomyces scabiei]|uniref:hypothetical protein n=1 Tax=Streptomyces scabiei TaxID=1930 RepID=UPI0038F8058D